MRFRHPAPDVKTGKIYPVFIPFAGCFQRCVFCAQEKQTGRGESFGSALESLVVADIESVNADSPVELAFYGGTFTALPLETQLSWLRLALRLKEQGKVSSVRCSTRPDALTPELLSVLKEHGLETIELGVQSFSDPALRAARRGYSGAAAFAACRMVKDSGLRLGIQLMPGMPAHSENDFSDDIKRTLELAPQMVRLYPCLVLRGTPLAEMWQNREFTPWSLEQVLDELPAALLALWGRGIPVIRMGLAPQPGLEHEILAGPAHPALGQRLRSLALCRFISDKLSAAGGTSLSLKVPKRFQGEFFGHRGKLKPIYAGLGLPPEKISWCDEEYFTLADSDSRVEQG